MQQFIDINADVGEGFENEAQLMPFLSSCNIACGGHAGTIEAMTHVVRLAKLNDVKIGAHPSFPDKDNFGRKIMDMPAVELYTSLKQQVRCLLNVLHTEGLMLHHIKPHGALYNLIAKDEEAAMVIIEVVKSIGLPIKLYAPYNSVIANMAISEHIEVTFEAFADRNYNEDLSLVSRQESDALITEKDAVFNHVHNMCVNQKVLCRSGVEVDFKASTYCIHGDTENAIEIAEYLTSKLKQNNILIQ
jgi:UPF0271 protein